MPQPITVAPLPAEILNKLINLKLTEKGQCYNNSLGAVLQLAKNEASIRYVVGWVTHPSDGIRTPHAFLYLKGQYGDATLEANNLSAGCVYEMSAKFDLTQILIMLKAECSSQDFMDMANSLKPWPNLKELGNGKIGFDF